jgi:hypothetical protein
MMDTKVFFVGASGVLNADLASQWAHSHYKAISVKSYNFSGVKFLAILPLSSHWQITQIYPFFIIFPPTINYLWITLKEERGNNMVSLGSRDFHRKTGLKHIRRFKSVNSVNPFFDAVNL